MTSIEYDVILPRSLCRDEIRVDFACGEYSSEWGISDFYPEAEEKIAEILEGSDEVFFDVSAKKEIQYATVYRNGDETYVNAWVTIENDSDIIFDVLEEAYPDMGYEELHPMAEEIMDESTFAGLDFDDWDDSAYFHETAKMTGYVSMDELKAVLNELIEKAEERGHWYYNSLVNLTRDYIDHRNHKEADAE